jgi:hypothetical protein
MIIRSLFLALNRLVALGFQACMPSLVLVTTYMSPAYSKPSLFLSLPLLAQPPPGGAAPMNLISAPPFRRAGDMFHAIADHHISQKL